MQALAMGFLALVSEVEAPAALGPVPSAAQLRWQRMERYAFAHFGPNTFSDAEWGTGKEDPKLFRPTHFDARQWARALKESGFGGLILTAKHHDGFCLWPSAHTRHSVAFSEWKLGEGDVVREVAAACKEFGIGFGVYLSPWDRHEPSYGDSQRYNDHYVAQLEELLTNYGPIFEVWWDGACGEGPNGKRQEYDWPRFRSVVRKLQPEAVIFSDVGPDVRWVGNERGFAGETCWSMQSPGDRTPGLGAPPVEELNRGLSEGVQWIPAECDVSIRPGWFYHASEDKRVKSVAELLEIYYASVGRNGNLLLNIPPDRRGLFHENDVARLKEFDRTLRALFAKDLARGAQIQASAVRGSSARYAATQVLDGDPDSYWALEDGHTKGDLTLSFAQAQRVDHVVLAEPIALGQRIAAFTIEGRNGETWRELARGTTIGAKRILRFAPVELNGLRVKIEDARGTLLLSSLELYCTPREAYDLVFAAPTTALLPALQFVRAPDPGWKLSTYEGELAKLEGLPGIQLLTQLGQSVVYEVNLRALTRSEHAALLWEGYLDVPSDGAYQFQLSSDDGSRLIIDDRLIVNNDHRHEKQTLSGTVGLAQGWHRVRLEYFQADGPSALELHWAGPGLGLKPVAIARERMGH